MLFWKKGHLSHLRYPDLLFHICFLIVSASVPVLVRLCLAKTPPCGSKSEPGVSVMQKCGGITQNKGAHHTRHVSAGHRPSDPLLKL